MITRSCKTGLFLFFVILLLLVTVLPVFAQSTSPDPTVGQGEAGGLVPCGRTLNKDGALENPCGFNDLIALGGRLTRWLVFIAAFVAAGTFTYAGYLYATAGGSEEQVKKAHSVFRVTLIGFTVVLAAWLIVYTIGEAVISPEKMEILQLN